jgi:WD40 repeat protein
MKRYAGLVAVLTWLALPWLWWQSERPVPRATVIQQLHGGGEHSFTSDARLFVWGDHEHIHVYDVRTGKQLATRPRLNALAAFPIFPVSVDGAALVPLHGDETVQIFDLISGKTVASFAPGPGSPLRIHLAPSGKVAATDHDNRILRVWDLETG